MSLWADPELQARWLADCRQAGVALNEAQIEQFGRFYDLLTEANQTMNLTRVSDAEGFLYRHLLDSLVLSPLITDGKSVIDIGSGAGFPAIPLAIARPDLKVTALDATGKKCRFIESVKEALGLKNLTILNARSEEVARNPRFRERFEVGTARAVAALPTLLELSLPLVTPRGLFLAMKGETVEAELGAARNALKALKAKVTAVQKFELAALERSRLVSIRKTASVPALYPRPSGMPAKKPL